MEYRFKQRVRYSEINAQNRLGISQIVNYFQDCSSFQSEDLGNGFAVLDQKHRAWFLLSWHIVIEQSPVFGQEISIGTWAYDWKKIYGYRNFDIQDESGTRMAYADSIWLYTNTETGTPERIDEEEVKLYGKSPRIDMGKISRKIALPKEYEPLEPFRITTANIDTNQHVNNAQYLKFAEEYIPNDFLVHEIFVEYRQAATLHDMIYPRITRKEEGYFVQLCNQEGSPYVIIKLQEKAE